MTKQAQASPREIRVVLNQCGAALELHGHAPNPIVIALIRPERLTEYGRELASKNPDMRYSTLGQISHGLARVWFDALDKAGMPELVLSPRVWTFNASTGEYN